MGAIPNLNFQPYNPMDTAIQTAMRVYGTGMQGQAQATENKMNKAKLPYVAQQEQALLDQRMMANELSKYNLDTAPALNEANMGLIGAQTENQLQQAAKTKNLLQMIQNYMGNGQQSGNTASGAAQGAQTSGNYPGPSAQEVYARKFAGLPEVTPEESSAIKLWENFQQKSMETQFPTSTTLTREQRLTDISPSWAKSLYEISETYGKSPKWNNATNFKYDWMPSTRFHKQIENAGEATAIGKNFGTDAGGLEKAESIISPAIGESKQEYSQRLYAALSDALPSIQSAYAAENKQVPDEFVKYLDKIRENAYPDKGSPSNQRSTAASNFEEEALNRGFKQVNGKWVKG